MVKLHLWLAINLSIFLLIFIYPYLGNTPLLFIFCVTSFLLKDKVEIHKEYKSPLGWAQITLFLVAVALLLMLLLSGQLVNSGQGLSESTTKTLAIVLGPLYIVSYFINIVRLKNEQVPNK